MREGEPVSTGEPTRADPLRDPGLRHRPAHLAVRVVALAYLSDARQALERWGGSGHRDDLHALRVALRRLRSWVRAHRPWLEGSVGRRDRRRLRRLARTTGRCRDLDVQLTSLASLKGLPPQGEAAVLWLARRLERARARAVHRARPLLEAEFPPLARRLERRLLRYRGTLDPDDPWSPPPSLGAASAPALVRVAVELEAALERIRTPSDRAAAHDARIEGKRLRYLLEPLKAGCDGADPLVRELRELQDLLGAMHDAHVLRRELSRRVEASRHTARGPEPEGVRALEEHLRATVADTFHALEERWLGGRAVGFVERVAAVAGELGEGAEELPAVRAPVVPPAIPAAGPDRVLPPGSRRKS